MPDPFGEYVKMSRNLIITILFAVNLVACVTVPMTPAEHREAGRSGRTIFIAKYIAESFEVKRPFVEVAQTFESKARECLSVSLASVTRPTIGFGQTTNVFGHTKSTVLTSSENAELHFQAKFKGEIAKTPEDSAYYLVADAHPVSKDRTKIDILLDH